MRSDSSESANYHRDIRSPETRSSSDSSSSTSSVASSDRYRPAIADSSFFSRGVGARRGRRVDSGFQSGPYIPGTRYVRENRVSEGVSSSGSSSTSGSARSRGESPDTSDKRDGISATSSSPNETPNALSSREGTPEQSATSSPRWLDEVESESSGEDLHFLPRGGPDQQYRAHLSQLQAELFNIFIYVDNVITISDDLSTDQKREERQLLALRDRTSGWVDDLREPPSPSAPPIFPLTRGPHPPRNMAQYHIDPLALAAQNLNGGVEAEFARPLKDVHFNGATSGKRSSSEMNSSEADLGTDVLSLGVQELRAFIERLENRATKLGKTGEKPEEPLRFQILYRIREEKTVALQRSDYPILPGQTRERKTVETSVPYFDVPEWVHGQDKKDILRSRKPVDNFELYLERNKNISFLVYRTYSIDRAGRKKRSRPSKRDSQPDVTVDETIQPIAESLIEALEALLESGEEYMDLQEEFKKTSELSAPYLFIYHRRKEMDAFLSGLSSIARDELSMLWNYVIQAYGDEYAAADTLISNGRIASKYIRYLFKPGDVVVKHDNQEHLGWVTKSWAQIPAIPEEPLVPGFKPPPPPGLASQPKKSKEGKWEIRAWRWEFDGVNFQRREDTLELSIPRNKSIKTDLGMEYTDKNAEEIFINELKVFPIQHADRELVEKLRRRGRTFWKCRNRALVSYQESDVTGTENLAEERYMIDYKTYRGLHKSGEFDSRRWAKGSDDRLSAEVMANDQPPDDQFELLLPAKIKGYNLRRKKWYDLAADRINDVKWNKEAFQKVVIDRKAKDLIRALISNQIESERSTDLIEGKGNGLILLLHGSPGTGKTLTAESVAEIAEKPLYRVTCGDVGTKAEAVEKYLESVLHLGKLWGCVVLLDEADVFLEQRSLEDLERNALVSVFLRILEYYEGILILTSNRVGIFDEAFKSRIQLALHYPTLGPFQRLRIWENFLDRLEEMHDEAIDIPDIRDHLEDLKEEEMNGRQIRNAITTARQYSKWKNATLTYKHLKDVIEIAGRFDKYLDKLNGGFTQDQIAQDEGLRFS